MGEYAALVLCRTGQCAARRPEGLVEAAESREVFTYTPQPWPWVQFYAREGNFAVHGIDRVLGTIQAGTRSPVPLSSGPDSAHDETSHRNNFVSPRKQKLPIESLAGCSPARLSTIESTSVMGSPSKRKYRFSTVWM